MKVFHIEREREIKREDDTQKGMRRLKNVENENIGTYVIKGVD